MKKKIKKKLEELCIVLINNKVMANLDFVILVAIFFVKNSTSFLASYFV
jgi:hypothetical protein